MKKSLIAILVSAAALSATSLSMAATGTQKATYAAAKDTADATYKLDREKCNSISGNPKDVCVAEAEDARTRAEADAKMQEKNTLGARTSARTAIANADYDVAKAKCGSQNGNEKDVCIKQAKAVKTAAIADAKADKKVAIAEGDANKKIVTARVDAADDKNTANYKVALEKCDSLAGPSKDSCVSAAKSQFGK